MIQCGNMFGVQGGDRRQRPLRVGGHGLQHPGETFGERGDVGGVEHLGVVFDAQGEIRAGLSLHGQRVVTGFAAADIADGEFVVTGQRGGVHRVVLVGEHRVEQLVLPGDAMNLVERQMLMFQRVVVGAVQLRQQIVGGGRRGDPGSYRHRVDEQADHGLHAGDFGGPAGDRGAERDVVTAGQPAQDLRVGGLQHRVDGGVPGSGQRRGGLGDTVGQHRGVHPAGPRLRAVRRPHQRRFVEVGEQFAPHGAGLDDVPARQPGHEVAVRRGGGQPVPVVAGEDLGQQDRHGPAVEHDVVIGQHEPVPVGWPPAAARCGTRVWR